MIGNMTVEELKAKLDAGENIKLIDCREQNEWDEAHIEKAEFMPLSNFASEMEKLSDKGETLILQCRSGKRSLQACMMLQGEGFENLFNLEGGIMAWSEKGYPTV